MRVELKGLVVRVLRFFRENPGALPVVGFQFLLLVCAFLLAFGVGDVAEGLAVVAYFLLVAGVVFQLVDYVRDSRG
ncbi:hypothetical protein J7L33_05920 [Candidatus Bathyarchaeota archaeon]|nr:hypothetical protein [Candidatus Bathyarchaeota archaeon]